MATSGSYTDLTNKPNLAAVATSGSYNDLSNTPNLAAVATSGSYNDLTNKPTIPTKTSDLTNDSNFVVSTSLATVATTGAYSDLSGTPNLATVATSGLATDLSGVLPLTNGGTGATNASDARANLGLTKTVIYESTTGTGNIYQGDMSLHILPGSSMRVGIVYKFYDDRFSYAEFYLQKVSGQLQYAIPIYTNGDPTPLLFSKSRAYISYNVSEDIFNFNYFQASTSITAKFAVVDGVLTLATDYSIAPVFYKIIVYSY